MTNDILELATDLMAIPSSYDDPVSIATALNVVRTRLRGYEIEEFNARGVPSLLFHNQKKGHRNFRVLLNAHLDVVKAPAAMFEPKIKDNQLYGRGAYDMKAAAAAMIMVFKHHADRVEYPLGLQIVSDEETGGYNGTRHQVQEGVTADFVIAGEPTDLKINHESKGIVWADITMKGTSSHSAYQWNGINPMDKFMENFQGLRTTLPRQVCEAWKTTATLTSLKLSGPSANSVPDELHAVIDVRYVPREQEQIRSLILDVFPTATFRMADPPHHADQKDEFVQKLAASITKHDTTLEFVQKHGGSDVRFYSEQGIPAVTFGPIGGGHHSDEEWVDIASLDKYYRIMVDFIKNV